MSRPRNGFQKTRQILGHVIHMRGITALHFPILAQHFA